MPHSPPDQRGLAVPASRLARLTRFGGLATSIAGRAAAQGARDLAAGRRPALRDLLLTPANASRVAGELAQMRGAAMKIGQLLSMEAGDLLPPELSDILARLRSDAHFMPPAQLKTVLVASWGPDFLRRFARFDVRPIAAASIGQVHRARLRDGRELAIKVQYPGIRRSIDSDVANVATLIRLSGLMPAGIDVTPFLDEAKRQLHEEADYRREGACLARFGALLADDPDFAVPALLDDLTTDNILAMSYLDGVAVESLTDAPQDIRDRILTRLVGLVLREVFDFGWMQTDPNFANYRYDPDSGRILLLDFGATRKIAPDRIAGYRRLLAAGLDGHRDALQAAAAGIGLIDPDLPAPQMAQLMDLAVMATAPLRRDGPYDFAADQLADRLRIAGMEMALQHQAVHLPPMDTLYVQRKVAGIYLLAARLRARVDLAALVAPWRCPA
jgi:predicted unusual protein kinase regulating ubiquinone biosynthesis (AarF/ABC1/UbiB family)